MSQIFCVRRDGATALAVLYKAKHGTITLLDTYPHNGEKASSLSRDLKILIIKHTVSEILVTPTDAGEPHASELFEFRELDIPVREMKSSVTAQSGLSAYSEMEKAGQIKFYEYYEGYRKLVEHVERLDKNPKTEMPAYVQAFFCGLMFADCDDEDIDEETLGSFAPEYDDYGGGGGWQQTLINSGIF